MNAPDRDSDLTAAALPAFISEAREQIEMLEQQLLQLESAPGDRELLDSLFRCAHTVKGSAGIFGLDDIVAFTHHVETLLDRLREGRLVLTAELSTLILLCIDQIRTLVRMAQDPGADEEGGPAQRAELVQGLRRAVGEQSAQARSATTPAPASGGKSALWQIDVQFGRDTFRSGMDPLAIFNYLRGLGSIDAIACNAEAVADLEEVDPEDCLLHVQLQLDTDATREQIEAAFSFVREDCTLQLNAAESRVDSFAERIEAMPDNPRLGEILVSVGAISHGELEKCLDEQRRKTQTSGDKTPLGALLQKSAGVSAATVDAALQKQQKQRQSPTGPAGSGDGGFIRVQADRLDAVINLIGELVIASAGASMLAHQTRNGTLSEANQQVGRLVEEIRNATLQLRMVPIGDTFSRFRRVVRDTAAELGKDVALEIAGGETELDKSMVERIADPLMHLVRNSLDHGLEPPAERTGAGKPSQGTLRLSACHESGSILISISDDGRGIDRQKVLQSAWARGVVESGVVPADHEILNLIFAAGVSTAEKVTNLSGRGVGMDVVRTNVQAMRGTVAVASQLGKGTRIDIRLPLTLAIIDGFLIGVGNSKFIFPLESVLEVIENRPTTSALDARGRSTVELRGRVLPVVDLRALYALNSPAPERSSVVVIQSGARRYGVMVDQLLGQHQTVIKPLGRMFRSLRGMSGSSILGNGEVALIFDASSLGELASSIQEHVPAH